MGVCYLQHRIAIGSLNPSKGMGKGRKRCHDYSGTRSCFSPESYNFAIKYLSSDIRNCCPSEDATYSPQQFALPTILYFIYLYFILILMLVSSTLTVQFKSNVLSWTHPSMVGYGLGSGLSLTCTTHIKEAYLYLICFALLKATGKHFSNRKPILSKNRTRLGQLCIKLILAILLLNFLLIGICNPSMLNPGPEKLKVSYQNVQGLIPVSQLGESHPKLNTTKIFELNAFLHDSKPDVLMLNETWLKKSIKDHEVIENQNYNIFRSDRSQITHPSDPNNPQKYKKSGGGVLIAVKSNIEASVKRVSMRKGAEIVSIELKFGSNKLILCTVYRVGTLQEQNHDSIMNSFKSFYGGRTHKDVVIIGDFNLNSVTWPLTEEVHNMANRIDKMFIDSFAEFGLQQCLESPTHNKGKVLDLLLTSNSALINDLKVHGGGEICKSDHYPISLSINTKFKFKEQPKRKVYNFKKANWDRLNSDINSISWNGIINGQEPEIAWRSFKGILFTLIDKHIPKITISNQFTSPWFDSECYEAYRTKERAHIKFKRNKNLESELKRDATRKHFKTTCSQKMRDNLYNKDDPALITKKFWSHVKASTKSQRIPECIHLNNRYRVDSKQKAELFNTFFFDQFSGASGYDVPIDWSNDNLFDIDFYPLKIQILLSNINSNKACGPDEIHGKILKYCSSSLCHPLSLIYKISYNTGCIPKDWKMANVVPVHKKGSKDDVENYRPISLTSLVMKIFERILKDEILLKASPLLDSRQHGFLRSKSCTTNMVIFSDSVVLSINDCKTFSTDVVYFDFTKAFDSVNHDLLLLKLKNYFGIDGRLLKFLKNYLCGREQCVVIDNVKSMNKAVLSGVPQGSILGPILFVLFINDLPLGLSAGTNLALYADDTKIWRSICSYNDHHILQSDIDYLNRWAINNKMKFHRKKCKVVSICSRVSPLGDKSSLGIFTFPFILYYYSIGGDPLQYADSEKDLGIIMNPSFNFNDHQEALLTKASQQFGLLKRTCHFVQDLKRKRALYLTLVRSQFEHCSPVWRPCNKTAITKFENFQKKVHQVDPLRRRAIV